MTHRDDHTDRDRRTRDRRTLGDERRDDLARRADATHEATPRAPVEDRFGDGRMPRERHLDRGDDPVDGEAVGGVSGLAAGAAIGAATGGPVGAVIGAAAGALTGVGVAKGVEALVDSDEEDAYWRENYSARPYAAADRDYDHYRPAYRYGWEAQTRYTRRPYDEIEPELERDWESYRGTSSLTWADARHATRDAWDRIERRRTGDRRE